MTDIRENENLLFLFFRECRVNWSQTVFWSTFLTYILCVLWKLCDYWSRSETKRWVFQIEWFFCLCASVNIRDAGICINTNTANKGGVIKYACSGDWGRKFILSWLLLEFWKMEILQMLGFLCSAESSEALLHKVVCNLISASCWCNNRKLYKL